MESLVAKSLSPEAIALLVMALVYLLKTIADYAKKTLNKTEDKTLENTQALKELNINILHLNARLVLVETAIDKLTLIQASIIKVEKDVHYAFERLRDLKSEISNGR